MDNGKLCFALLETFSAAKNYLPRCFMQRGKTLPKSAFLGLSIVSACSDRRRSLRDNHFNRELKIVKVDKAVMDYYHMPDHFLLPISGNW
jgi:hypothetical protein